MATVRSSEPTNSDNDVDIILANYFDWTENPSLEQFLSQNASMLALPGVMDIRQYWTGIYKRNALKMNKPFIIGTPDWYNLLLQSCSPNTAPKPPVCTDESSTSNGRDYNQKMKQNHSILANSDKWVLPSGTIVEDEMLEYCQGLDYEHSGHSFILDKHDKCWERVFSPADLNHIKTTSLPLLPPISDESVLHYLSSFNGKTSYNDIMETVTSIPYKKDEGSDVNWLRHSILTHMMNMRTTSTMCNFSETDLMLRIWSPLRYLCDDTLVTTETEKESLASSSNENENRTLGKRKSHGIRPDVRFKYDGLEIGCGEAGKMDEGEYGTKEMNESKLKCPKVLRDMLVHLLKKYPDKKKELRTYGFVMMGYTGSFMIMDCPGGIVSRVSRTPRSSFTADVGAFVTRSIPIFVYFLQVKYSMINLLEVLKMSQQQPITIMSTADPPFPYSLFKSSPSSSSTASKATTSSTSTASKATTTSSSGDKTRTIKKLRSFNQDSYQPFFQ